MSEREKREVKCASDEGRGRKGAARRGRDTRRGKSEPVGYRAEAGILNSIQSSEF